MAWYECASSPAYIIDSGAYINNAFIQRTNGEEEPYTGWQATPYIRVYGGETLKFAIPAGWQDYNCWYDSNMTYISKFSFSASGYITTTAPANACYMRMSEQTGRMAYLMAWRDDGMFTRLGGLYSTQHNVISTTYTVNS